jgi:hypothetical protein
MFSAFAEFTVPYTLWHGGVVHRVRLSRITIDYLSVSSVHATVPCCCIHCGTLRWVSYLVDITDVLM